MIKRAGLERADIAGKPLSGLRGDKIEARSRPARAQVDDEHEPAEAADLVLLGQPADLGIDGVGDLLGNQAPRVPHKEGEQKGGEQREQDEISQRQPECSGAEELT